MSHMLIHFSAILFSFKSNTLHAINVYVFTWMLFWIKYFDLVLGRYALSPSDYTRWEDVGVGLSELFQGDAPKTVTLVFKPR